MKVLNGTNEEKAEEKKDECGSCYGAERHDQPCCATCDDIKIAYKRRGKKFSYILQDSSNKYP